MSCNFVCIGEKETHGALLIDPGGHPEVILREVTTRGLYPTMILHTLTRFDHVRGTRMVSDETADVVGLCGEDKHGDPIILPKTGKTIGRVIHTPGHTPGSCCFYFYNGDEPALCTGDAFFRRYIGRTDVLLADLPQLKLSILKRMYTLPPATAVIPGHGDLTTIEEEREGNLFVRHYTMEEEMLKEAPSSGARETGGHRESKGRALREALRKKRGGGGNGGSSGGATGLGSGGTSAVALRGGVGKHDPAGITPDDIAHSEDASEASPIVKAFQTVSGFLRKVRPVVEALRV
ncbi:Metallo-hydrolase/oxidoreductase [Gonapodya prolifera JEL478]|uniref:Metallo-hydrolase/oxidoreductase n=1 Tax=Gonapodya prolifera (strain JEL478) TaxID=1344416 RepID=A0A139AES7_GONPJ|nr:Metallo-hydrolase/oxidoreductase [Gonapodya prolifera JEL478]|eukprot:KXS14923.1 Metallo-hydrolase/oxidoreductase [Gonapodya prolifera JEL478]